MIISLDNEARGSDVKKSANEVSVSFQSVMVNTAICYKSDIISKEQKLDRNCPKNAASEVKYLNVSFTLTVPVSNGGQFS